MAEEEKKPAEEEKEQIKEKELTPDEKEEAEVLGGSGSKEGKVEEQTTREEVAEDRVVEDVKEKLKEKETEDKRKEPEVDLVDKEGKKTKLQVFKEEAQKASDEEEEIDLKELGKKFTKGVKGFFSSLKEKEQANEKEPEIDVKTADEKEEEVDLAEKREEIVKFFREKWNWLVYGALAIIIWFGYYIRTRNIPLLKDITTGKFVPLALDPHVFLRYGRYILEHGQIMAVDFMRNYPYGYHTPYLLGYMSKFIIGIYKFLKVFSSSMTFEYAHVLYPAITFVISMVFFFLLVKRLFNFKVALLATSLLSVIPAYLYRTMAGFSDHEAAGMMFMFMAFYFFVVGLDSKKTSNNILFALLASFSTIGMGMMWGGGVKFVYIIIGTYAIFEILLNKFEKQDFHVYACWFIPIVVIMNVLRLLPVDLLIGSFTSGIMVIAFLIGLMDFILFKLDLFKIKSKVQGRMPLGLASVLISAIIGMIGISILIGPGYIFEKVGSFFADLINPFGKTRWHLTVAESHQPYWIDVIGQLGGWIYMILFLAGCVWLFYEMTKSIRNSERMVGIFALFLVGFVFSRYKQGSLFDGVTPLSKIIYVGSLLAFVGIVIGIYVYSFYKDKTLYHQMQNMGKKYTFVFIWVFLMIVAARGAIRLIFVLAPITTIMVSYASFEILKIGLRLKDDLYKWLTVALLVIILLNPFAFAQGMIPKFAKSSLSQAKYTGPSYNRQWQIAGEWIREETPLDAVFGHWWDYGYWVQTGGERATVTDGGNNIGVWNFYMGRHALCGQNQSEALEFLYAHNVSHFLIISDEIGKYTAYSSIGGGVNYERYSWITNFRRDNKQTQETRNGTIHLFTGQYILDEDFIYKDRIYPAKQSAIIAVFLPIDNVEVMVGNETQTIQQVGQPEVVLAGQNGQEKVPLQCVYLGEKMYKFKDNNGYKGCFRVIPTVHGNGQLNDVIGAGLMISERGVKAIWTQLYLFEQNDPDYDTSAYKLVYNDEDQMPLALYAGRQIGPLKIWEIEYPEDIEFRGKYLAKSYKEAGLEHMQKI